MAEQGGVVIERDDGSLYFIREELLEMCQVPPDDEDTTRKMLDHQKKGGAGKSVKEVTAVRYSSEPEPDDTIQQEPNVLSADEIQSRLAGAGQPGAKSSTIMCCW